MPVALSDRISAAWEVFKKGGNASREVVATPLAASAAPAVWAGDPHEQVRRYRHWVYVAVRAIASRVAGTNLNFYRNDTGEALDALHPLCELMREVNPFETAISLWQKTLTFLDKYVINCILLRFLISSICPRRNGDESEARYKSGYLL